MLAKLLSFKLWEFCCFVVLAYISGKLRTGRLFCVVIGMVIAYMLYSKKAKMLGEQLPFAPQDRRDIAGSINQQFLSTIYRTDLLGVGA
jgi:uncharacterized membrane protein